MSTADLKRILDLLPPPNRVLVSINYQESSAFNRYLEDIKNKTGFQLSQNSLSPSLELILENPTTKQILALHEGNKCDPTKAYQIMLNKAEWYNPRIVIDGYSVEVSYCGKEPRVVRKLQDCLRDSEVRLAIKVN